MSRSRQKYLKNQVVPIKWSDDCLPNCCVTTEFEGRSANKILPEQEAVRKAKALKEKADKLFPLNDTGTLTLPRDSAVYQAVKIVRGDRQMDYGSPEKDFQRTTDMLSAYGFRFEDENGNIRKLEPTDYPLIMIMAKLGRQANKHKDDNIIDIIGYADTFDMVKRAQRNKEQNFLPDLDEEE